MEEENLSIEEITATSLVQTNNAAVLDMPGLLLELFAETYAESAMVAFKKYIDGPQNG